MPIMGLSNYKDDSMPKNISVLVIDDDSMIRSLLQNALTSKGFEVFVADGGLDGLDLAKTKKTDVILLDWMMPEMDGIEVLEELKRNGDTMHIPVFMLTSKEDSKDLDLAIRKGAADYIIKPFKDYEVPEMVFKHLETVHGKRSKQGFFSKIFSH